MNVNTTIRIPKLTGQDLDAAIARAEKAEAERDALAAALDFYKRRIHVREHHNQEFYRCESSWCNPSPMDPSGCTCDPTAILAARDASKTAEGRKAALLEVAQIAKGLSDLDLHTIRETVRRMAEGADK